MAGSKEPCAHVYLGCGVDGSAESDGSFTLNSKSAWLGALALEDQGQGGTTETLRYPNPTTAQK